MTAKPLSVLVAALALAALAPPATAPPATAQSNPTVPALSASPVPPLGASPARPRQPSAPATARRSAPNPRATAPRVQRRSSRQRFPGGGIGRHELLNPEVLDYFHSHRHEFSGFQLRAVRVNGITKFLVVLRRK
ncbi:MAG: hypothetical protein V3T29_04630 [Alphaproteobacteria bacterium]